MDSAITSYIETSFRKIRELRKSDKGEVWLASDASGKLVVVKRILLTGLPYPILKEHPQPICPRILYCAEDEAETVVVEEFVQGDALLERLEEGRCLTEKEAESILLQLCDGLAPLHERGIIHRDIKPSNLILQHGGLIRLIDFDAARTVKEGGREDTHRLGTKGYAPPEQFGYGQTDARSDIYSIGVTMRKMLGKEYQSYLTDILSKCTEIDPHNRYETVFALKRAILWRSRKRLVTAIVILFVILLGVGFVYHTENLQGLPTHTAEPSGETSRKSPSPPQQPENLAPSENADASPGQPLPTGKTVAAKEQNPMVAGQKPSDEMRRLDAASQEDGIPMETANSSEAIRQSAPVPEPVSISPIETSFSLNGIGIGSAQGGDFSLDPSEWHGFRANLHVENSTNANWENPSIRIVFKDNWGGSYTETKFLPSIAPGESSDFSIPVGAYPVTIRSMDTSAWLQVYLNTGNLPSSERYWCVQFHLHGDEKNSQPRKS